MVHYVSCVHGFYGYFTTVAPTTKNGKGNSVKNSACIEWRSFSDVEMLLRTIAPICKWVGKGADRRIRLMRYCSSIKLEYSFMLAINSLLSFPSQIHLSVLY